MTEPRDALLTGLAKLGQEELYAGVIATTQALNESWYRINVTIPKQLKGEGEKCKD